jgi:hypothetical protein
MPQSTSDVYYKIQVPTTAGSKDRRHTPHMTICTVQDFDEYDYVQEEWLRDDDGVVSFDSKEEAREYLAANVDEEFIHPEDRLVRNHVNQYRQL